MKYQLKTYNYPENIIRDIFNLTDDTDETKKEAQKILNNLYLPGLEQIIEKLGEKHSMIIKTYYKYGLTQKEISEKLNVSTGYIGQAIKRNLMILSRIDNQERYIKSNSCEKYDISEKRIGTVLDLNRRTLYCLYGAGITTIADLENKTPDELIRIKHFGKRCMEELKQQMDKHNLQLKQKTEGAREKLIQFMNEKVEFTNTIERMIDTHGNPTLVQKTIAAIFHKENFNEFLELLRKAKYNEPIEYNIRVETNNTIYQFNPLRLMQALDIPWSELYYTGVYIENGIE